MSTSKVVIVMAKCSHSKQSYGIRFEQKLPHQWVADWAFAIKEAAAKREGYDRSEIMGSFSFDAAYPGCPHCESPGIFKCSCLPRQKLCELIANPKYGRTLCDNPQGCEGLLRDFCGQYR
jgi:hypothetical protein